MLVITIENPWAFGFGLLGNVVSFMVCLSPMPTFYRVYKKKSTESFQSIPYVVALFSATLWLYYAILSHDILVLTINAATSFIEFIYLAIYLTYAPKKARAFTLKLIFLVNMGVSGCIVLFTMLLLKGRMRIDIAGWICTMLAVGVFIAPLSVIKLVLKTKSVEYMPFSLSFFLTLCAVTWFCYGLLQRDFFIALPNVFGFMFGMAQMILYFTYMNTKKAEPEIKTVEQPIQVLSAEIQLIEDRKNISEDSIKASATAQCEIAKLDV